MKNLTLLNITKEERNDYFKDYYNQGYTYSEIAKATGYSYDTVRGVLRNYRPSRHNYVAIDVDPLSELHNAMGLNETQNNQELEQENVQETVEEENQLDFTNVKWVANNTMINLVVDGEVFNADCTHPNFKEIISKCLENDFATAVTLINTGKTIEKWSMGVFDFSDGILTYCGHPLHGLLIDKIIESIRKGDDDVNKYVYFLQDALLNSKNSFEEMWNFMKHNDIQIHPNGAIVCYKKVTTGADGKLYDSYTTTVPNDVGTLVQMPRHLVDDDKNQTCSYGLHVGSIDYVKNFNGDRIIKVLVAPHNIVSVPTDYNGQKMRCAEYFVIQSLDDDLNVVEEELECKYVATVNRSGLFRFEENK